MRTYVLISQVGYGKYGLEDDEIYSKGEFKSLAEAHDSLSKEWLEEFEIEQGKWDSPTIGITSICYCKYLDGGNWDEYTQRGYKVISIDNLIEEEKMRHEKVMSNYKTYQQKREV